MVKPIDEGGKKVVKAIDKEVVKPAVQFVDKATGEIVKIAEGVGEAFEGLAGDIAAAYNAVSDGIASLGLEDIGKAIALATTGSGLSYLIEAGAAFLNSAVVSVAVDFVKNAGQVIATTVVGVAKRMYQAAGVVLRAVGDALATVMQVVVDGKIPWLVPVPMRVGL